MKKVFHLVLCLCGFVSAFAQDPEAINAFEDRHSISIYDEEALPVEAYTLVTDANVRATPSVKGTVVTTLPINSKVTVEGITTDSFTMNGYRAPWYKISFTANNKAQKGFIWSGFLATTRIIDEAPEEHVYFLCGVSGWNENDHQLKVQVRAVQGGKEIAKQEFVTSGDPSYDIEAKLEYSNLKNVKNILRINTVYGACGYTSDYNLVFFGNNKLTHVLKCSQISDAGVFSSGEHAILPGDPGGIIGHILVTSDECSFEEKDDDFVVTEQKYSVTLYKWTGVELKKVPLK